MTASADHDSWDAPKYLKAEDCDGNGYCVHCGTATTHVNVELCQAYVRADEVVRRVAADYLDEARADSVSRGLTLNDSGFVDEHGCVHLSDAPRTLQFFDEVDQFLAKGLRRPCRGVLSCGWGGEKDGRPSSLG